MARAALSAPRTLGDFKSETIRGTAGFVRVGQTNAGQWWLIDANDRPFFSRGVAAVNRGGRAGGRTAQPGPYELAVDRLHGAADPQPFVTSVFERLRSWHCNTIGAAGAPEFFDREMFYTETLGFRFAAPESTIKLCGALLPDVFDPRWTAACDLRAAETCVTRRGARGLIGYFTDHGLQWAQPRLENPAARAERPSLLQICLSLEPSFPAYHAAWEFALAPFAGDLAALAKDWEIAPNKEALRQRTLADTALRSAGYRRDQERFSREFARRYVHTCAAAVQRYDPNHLVLGCDFDAPPGNAVLAEFVSPGVGVLSISVEHDALFETVEEYARLWAMPVLVAEFSWTGEAFTQTPMTRGSHRLTSVERMLAKGRAALTRACTHPALVGYAWSRWADAPDDLPPFGRGVVHIDDSEAREHTELLADLNARAESLRRAAAIRPAPATES